jgi:hypothetical protein
VTPLGSAFTAAPTEPESLTEARLAELAPLLDVLLSQDEPLATADITAPWTYVLGAFEVGSPVRTMIEKVIRGRSREMYMTIAESWVAEGEAKGRAAGLAEALLRVLELRRVSIPEPVRQRVSSSRDEHQLERWLDRALTVGSAQEVLDG